MTPEQIYDQLTIAADALDTEARELNKTAADMAKTAGELRDRVSALQAQASQLRERAFQQLPNLEDEETERKRSCLGKRAYRTPAAAGDAASSIGQRRDVNLRIYPCRFCKQYHFTSMTAEQYVAHNAA